MNRNTKYNVIVGDVDAIVGKNLKTFVIARIAIRVSCGRIKAGRQPKKIKKTHENGMDCFSGCKIVFGILQNQKEDDDQRVIHFENDGIYKKITKKKVKAEDKNVGGDDGIVETVKVYSRDTTRVMSFLERIFPSNTHGDEDEDEKVIV